MEEKIVVDLINLIKNISIHLDDVTTETERNDGYKVVIATYQYKSLTFKTKRLFYRNVLMQDDISHQEKLPKIFGSTVYWLDHHKHNWPHGAGAEIEKTVIDDMISEGDMDFKVVSDAIGK